MLAKTNLLQLRFNKRRKTTGHYELRRYWPLLNFNYGQKTQGGAYNTTEITQDLDFLQGISQDGQPWVVRVAMSNYQYSPGVNTSKQLALDILARGGIPMWGVGHPGFGQIKDTTWEAYVNAVLDAAAWAQANGIPIFSLGNEIEYGETVYGWLTNSVAKIHQLNTDVQLVYSGITSYQMAQSAKEWAGAPNGWIQLGKGGIGQLGYNAYGDKNLSQSAARTQWQNRINDLNSNALLDEVTEWSYSENTSSQPTPPTLQAQADEVAVRRNFLIEKNVRSFAFCYSWDNHWSMKGKPCMDELTKQVYIEG